MRNLLRNLSLLATIVLEVIPAILKALDAFEKHKKKEPLAHVKKDS